MVSGVVAKVFWSWTRTKFPESVGRAIIRTVPSVTVSGASPCCENPQAANQSALDFAYESTLSPIPTVRISAIVIDTRHTALTGDFIAPSFLWAAAAGLSMH